MSFSPTQNLPPTLQDVFNEYSQNHAATYGVPFNRPSGADADIAATWKAMTDEADRRMASWNAAHGTNLPRPPSWVETWNEWNNQHISAYGRPMDRAWGADQDASNQKLALDKAYANKLNEYNSQYGTQLTPDESVLGTDSQTTGFLPKPQKQSGLGGSLAGAALGMALGPAGLGVVGSGMLSGAIGGGAGGLLSGGGLSGAAKGALLGGLGGGLGDYFSAGVGGLETGLDDLAFTNAGYDLGAGIGAGAEAATVPMSNAIDYAATSSGLDPSLLENISSNAVDLGQSGFDLGVEAAVPQSSIDGMLQMPNSSNIINQAGQAAGMGAGAATEVLGQVPQQEWGIFKQLANTLGIPIDQLISKTATDPLLAGGIRLLEALNSQSNANRLSGAVQGAANAADPFAAQRPFYQQQLLQSYLDPNYFKNNATFSGIRNTAMSDVERAAAARGYNRSTNVLYDIGRRINDEGMKYALGYQGQLASNAGAGVSPQEAGRLQMQGAQLSNQAQNQTTGAVGNVLASLPNIINSIKSLS